MSKRLKKKNPRRASWAKDARNHYYLVWRQFNYSKRKMVEDCQFLLSFDSKDPKWKMYVNRLAKKIPRTK